MCAIASPEGFWVDDGAQVMLFYNITEAITREAI